MKVIMVAAISADGFIAETTDQNADWTSKEDKQAFMALTKNAGVMIMGRTTAVLIGKALKGRKTYVYTKDEKFAMPGTESTRLEPQELIKKIATEGYKEIAVCGGAQIYSMFLDAGLVDEIYLTVEPVMFGNGVPLTNLTKPIRLEFLTSKNLNSDTVLLHFACVKTKDVPK